MVDIAGHSAESIGIDSYKHFQSEDDQYWWAVDLWWSLKSMEEKYRYLLSVLNAAPDDDLSYFVHLGAGRLEDLNVKQLVELFCIVDREEADSGAVIEKKICTALKSYRFSSSSTQVDFSQAKRTVVDRIRRYYPSFKS